MPVQTLSTQPPLTPAGDLIVVSAQSSDRVGLARSSSGSRPRLAEARADSQACLACRPARLANEAANFLPSVEGGATLRSLLLPGLGDVLRRKRPAG
ncbi:uncharacterized protein PSFLO_02011 [Pseudozyma flocculosa]|uniref:Uncharacterized protein n=1 Tax=Pseudozyma flocculosa TaxID=84751 RepID=A0A5C3EXF5_9BASI|nr:uncharacterized protein PSFLO_02011 [Pseudozyma flocculosa]